MSTVKTSLVAVAWLAVASTVSAQVPAPTVTAPSLAAARNLYASAEYGGALDMLNNLAAQTPDGSDRQSIDLYRTLCLVAVGNTDKATEIIDAMITQDPLYRPASDDVPPRLQAAFSDARRRLLPGIVQQTYVQAKTSFEKKEYAAAAKGFTRVLAGLNDPDIKTEAAEPPLADLKMLATGFKDLAAKAIAPPPPPPPAPVVETVVNKAPRIYGSDDRNVVPPITVRQEVPPYPGRVLVPTTALIEIVIDETGAVESADMETPLNTAYDRLAVAAAQSWQYRPATLNGKPVKFRKRIQISLVPASGR